MEKWYVRPAAGGPYGLGNGRHYDDAWSGFNNIVWGPAGVKPKDTLFYSGTFFGEQLNIGESGLQGSPIVIRGDYPGDPGIIDGDGTANFAIFGAARTDIVLLNGTVRNTRFYAIDFDNGTGTDTVSRRLLIRNMKVLDVLGGETSDIGIRGSGKDVEIDGCFIDNVSADGIWWRGSPHVHHCTIRRSSANTDFGDCIQLSEDASTALIEHNVLNHVDVDSKYCVIINGSGSGSIIRWNSMDCFPNGLVNCGVYLEGVSDPKVYGNRILEGRFGIQLTTNPNGLVFSNNIFAPNERGIALGSGSAGCRAVNNVIRGGQRGVMSESVAETNEILNNVIFGTTVYGVDKRNGDIEDYNCIYKAGGSDSTHPLGSKTLLIDPKLDASGRPREQVLEGAGVSVPEVQVDYTNSKYAVPRSIGAFEIRKTGKTINLLENNRVIVQSRNTADLRRGQAVGDRNLIVVR